jgi:nucleotide-binding universal stress UspA family protein
MKEFTKRHYPEAKYTVLHGEPETEIVNHLKDDGNNSLVVLGAYRRGVVSRWFRPSMADVLIHSINAPLFVAHK